MQPLEEEGWIKGAGCAVNLLPLTVSHGSQAP